MATGLWPDPRPPIKSLRTPLFTPADAARLVAWPVSDQAEWVTGQVIASDCGWSTV